jgi:hypothetical protein
MKRTCSSIGSGCHVVLLCVALLALTSCGSSSDASTIPTGPSPTLATETFSGDIAQNGTQIFNFTVATSGNTLLAGYTSISPASIASLGMGIGVWDTTTSTCGLNMSQNDAAKSGSTAISGTANSGAYCVRVYDGGNIPAGGDATFSIQVQHF